MVQWLKYFFGNFFNKKYAEQSAKRSYCNGLLSFLLAMILLLVLIATMAMVAFPAYYDNSQEFSAYYRGLFDGDNALSLSIIDGKADLTVAGNDSKKVINTYLDEQDKGMFSDGKYNLVVDVRDISALYNDCTVNYVNRSDKKKVIDYDKYMSLSDNEKRNYYVSVICGNEVLQIDEEKINTYVEFVVQNGSDNAKNKLNAFVTDGKVAEEITVKFMNCTSTHGTTQRHRQCVITTSTLILPPTARVQASTTITLFCSKILRCFHGAPTTGNRFQCPVITARPD